jgi:mannose-6-phosphate isomerase-like protein (cupin superfamily)
MPSGQAGRIEKAIVNSANVSQEYFFRVVCYITELSNSDVDPELSVARARVEPGKTTRWHCLHDITERYVILSGIGRIEVGDTLAESVITGDVVVIPSGVRQRISNCGDSDLVFLALCTPRFIDQAYEDLEVDNTE